MALLEKQTANLRTYHPKAQMWVSPQSFNAAWLDEFFGILKHGAGLARAASSSARRSGSSLPELRAAVPKQYPIRHYPDITHSRQCQYPVPGLGRRLRADRGPRGRSTRGRCDRRDLPAARSRTPIGFITYSEGCNDDVNKIVWSALGWDPEADVDDILREYGRYFIGATLRRPLRPGAARAGAELARAAARRTTAVDDDAAAVPGDGARRPRPRMRAELAVPAGAVPGVLRRLRPRPAAVRDGRWRARRMAQLRERRRAGSLAGHGRGPRRSSTGPARAARRPDWRARVVRAGRGAVPEHPACS